MFRASFTLATVTLSALPTVASGAMAMEGVQTSSAFVLQSCSSGPTEGECAGRAAFDRDPSIHGMPGVRGPRSFYKFRLSMRSRMYPACRIASATIVSVGLAFPLDGN